MIHLFIVKVAVSPRDWEGVVIGIKRASAPLELFYISSWVICDSLPLVNLKFFIVNLVKGVLEEE